MFKVNNFGMVDSHRHFQLLKFGVVIDAPLRQFIHHHAYLLLQIQPSLMLKTKSNNSFLASLYSESVRFEIGLRSPFLYDVYLLFNILAIVCSWILLVPS